MGRPIWETAIPTLDELLSGRGRGFWRRSMEGISPIAKLLGVIRRQFKSPQTFQAGVRVDEKVSCMSICWSSFGRP